MPLSNYIDPSGQARTDMPEPDPEDPDYTQQKSDQLYFQSFGPGKFDPNKYGGLTFSPQGRPLPSDSNQSDPQVRANQATGQGMSGGTGGGQGQIRSLQQLAAVAKALGGVPEELKSRILSHLLGLPYKGPREQALENALLEARAKYQMAAPDRQLKQAQLQQGQDFRQKMQQMLLKLRQEGHTGAEANRQAILALHKDTAKNTIANSIANLTRAMEATVDPNQKTELGKMLVKQHQLYDKFMGLEPDDKTQGAQGNEPSGAAQ